MSFSELAASRYSVRDFLPLPVAEETLQAILEAGRVAPTACNNQPQRIYILRRPELLEKIRAITPCAFNAPLILLFGASGAEAWKNPFSQHSSAEMDASIVATHLMLQAAELGVGSTWVAWADWAKVEQAFDVPEGVKLYGLLALGYASEKGTPAPQHSKRKPLTDTTVEL